MMQTRTRETYDTPDVTFFETGTQGAGQYHCPSCGYGITIHAPLPICPMCAGTVWEQVSWTPFARALEELQTERLRSIRSPERTSQA